MATEQQQQQELQAYLDSGIRGVWYPVLASWEVHHHPLGITRLNEQIVIWRDTEGEVHALEDRCPHRGARLSLGWNLGDRIACWYHGVEVNGTGKVVDVPAVEHCPLVGEACVKAYAVQEHFGAVFLYFPVIEGETPPDLVFPQELCDGEQYSHFLCSASWQCNYQLALENVMDPMHGAYLHSSSHSMAEGMRQAQMVLEPTQHGYLFKKSDQAGVNFDWVEFGSSGTNWLRLSIPYRQRFGPGGHFWIVGMVVPEDNDHCRVFFWRIRKVQGWQRNLWRFMYRNRLEKLHWDVLEQDRIVLENMAPDCRSREYLYQHDVGMSRLRRTFTNLGKKHLQQQRQQATTAQNTLHPQEA
ncbi:MAG: Rieske 2Fe-2S domain-containing protein [Enterobacteriaceae bacterium]